MAKVKDLIPKAIAINGVDNPNLDQYTIGTYTMTSLSITINASTNPQTVYLGNATLYATETAKEDIGGAYMTEHRQVLIGIFMTGGVGIYYRGGYTMSNGNGQPQWGGWQAISSSGGSKLYRHLISFGYASNKIFIYLITSDNAPITTSTLPKFLSYADMPCSGYNNSSKTLYNSVRIQDANNPTSITITGWNMSSNVLSTSNTSISSFGPLTDTVSDV